MFVSLLLLCFMCLVAAEDILYYNGNGNESGNENTISNIYDNCLQACYGQPYGYKIADPSDCTGYILCHGYMIIQQYCEAGKVFKMAVQMCIPGRCPPCIVPPPSITPNPPINSSPTPPNSIVTTPDSDTPDCSRVEPGHHFPHSIHCRFFWQCVNNRAVRLLCEKGMWYDRDYLVCNFPSMVHNCPANQD